MAEEKTGVTWNVWGVPPIHVDPKRCRYVVWRSDTGLEWSHKLPKDVAETVASFANWLEREQSLDKQPGEFPALQKVLDDWQGKCDAKWKEACPSEAPDVVRDVGLSESTFQARTLATSGEFEAALKRGDHLIYARRNQGGLWDYIVEKYPEEISQGTKPTFQGSHEKYQSLLADAKGIEEALKTLGYTNLQERARRLVTALES